MSEPRIFAEVLDDLRHGALDAEHAAEHSWDAFTRHIPHRRYHQDSTTATPATEAPMPSIVDKVTSDFHEAASNIHGWISDFEQHLPTLLGDVTKIEQHPIVQEILKLGETVLPPEIVQSVIGLINMGAKMAGGAVAAAETAAAPVAPVAAAAPDAPAQTPAPVAG